MNRTRDRLTLHLSRMFFITCVILGLVSGAGPAEAQLFTPLGLYHTASSILDESGQPLQGTINGWPADGDLLMVLWASNNLIHPPNDIWGTPDPQNPPVVDFDFWTNGITWIGLSGLGSGSLPGTFDVSAHNTVRQNTERWIFVRAFNAHTPTGASFYADSDLKKVLPDGNLDFTIYRTDKPLDPGDNDGDGLNNSWEESLGTDPDNEHSDTDGVNDYEEWVAGTDGRDPNSVFIFARIQRGLGDDAVVAWDSVAGKRYRLYYTLDPLDSDDPPPAWTLVSGDEPITATDVLTAFPVASGLSTGRGFYRVRVLREDE